MTRGSSVPMRPRPNGIRQVGDLSLDEDLEFQERSWRWQRFGQLAIGLFVLAGLAGVFGGGGVARKEISEASGALRVTHPRFVRAHAPFDLKVELPAVSPAGGRVELWLEDSLLEALQVEKISPEPEAERLGGERVIYTFAFDEIQGRPAPIHLRLEATKIGWRTGRIGLTDGPTLTVKQLIYP